MPIAIGIIPASAIVGHRATNSSHVVGALSPSSSKTSTLYQMTLVTSALAGTITILSSTVMLLKALSSNSSPSSVSATAS